MAGRIWARSRPFEALLGAISLSVAAACSSPSDAKGDARGSGAFGGGASGAAGSAGSATGGTPGGSGGSAGGGSGNSGGSAGANLAGSGGALNRGGAGGSGGSTPCEPQFILVVDRSYSMGDNEVAPGVTRWNAVFEGIQRADLLMGESSRFGWGMKLFPEGDQDAPICGADSVTDLIDVPVRIGNASAVAGALVQVEPVGQGTPTGRAITVAAAHLETLAPFVTGPRNLVLITDDAPNCGQGETEDTGIGRQHTLAAISYARSQGFFTYVIGIGVAEAEETLNALADEGGKPVPNADPTAPHYYAAESALDVSAALEAIALDPTCP